MNWEIPTPFLCKTSYSTIWILFVTTQELKSNQIWTFYWNIFSAPPEFIWSISFVSTSCLANLSGLSHHSKTADEFATPEGFSFVIILSLKAIVNLECNDRFGLKVDFLLNLIFGTWGWTFLSLERSSWGGGAT